MQPTHLGPYTIQSRLGRGGMGAVYEAVDTTTGGTVAVKVLASHLADDAGLRRRFEAEIDTLKGLRHPGIVRLLAFGEQDDQPYFAMELVRGKSLEQILRGGRRFTWRETLAIAAEITRALKVAHDHGIVHRDLKPANLLVADTPSGDPDNPTTIKLADFGIAKLFGGAAHTALGNVVGTAEYMAPEQAMGKQIDHRVDLYALGLVMYAMLTGAPPFRGSQLTEVLEMQRRTVPPRVASLVANLPPEFDELIVRLLAKDPAHRPASALAVGRLLAAIDILHPPAPAPDNASGGTAAVERSATPPPTAHERSNRPTLPLDQGCAPTAAFGSPGAASNAASAPGQGPDLLAPTQAFPGPAATAPPPKQSGKGALTHRDADAATQDFILGSATARTADSSPPDKSSRLPTDVASASTQVDRGPRNRFMTVEEFFRVNEDQTRRDRRRQAWWQGLAACALLAALSAGGWLLLTPPSADQLHSRIMTVADDTSADLRDARHSIEIFLDRHSDDARAAAIADLKHTLDLDTLERRGRRRLRTEKGTMGLTPPERDYRAAITNEEHGPSACLEALKALLAVHGASGQAAYTDAEGGLWLDLARRQVERIQPQADREQHDDLRRIGGILTEAESLAARASTASKADRIALLARRRQLLESVIEVYENRPHAQEAVSVARRAIAADAPTATDIQAAPAVPPPDSPPPTN